ncbi:hypothetical protein BH10PSE16_BH10PSE16_22970 [soil metagenome]
MTMRQQSGVTLISLMIGLTISMILTVAMLTVFKSVILSTGGARAGASTDEQRTAALLRANLSLQDAGYGIDAPASPHDVLVLSNATLDKTTNRLAGSVAANGTAGNAVVWSLRPDLVTLQCAGLIYDSATDGTGGLKYLPAQACTAGAAGSWQTLVWAPAVWAVIRKDSPPEFPALSSVTWTLQQTSCKPFGITATEGSLTLTLNTDNGNGAVLSDTLCLINFHS